MPKGLGSIPKKSKKDCFTFQKIQPKQSPFSGVTHIKMYSTGPLSCNSVEMPEDHCTSSCVFTFPSGDPVVTNRLTDVTKSDVTDHNVLYVC